MSTTVLAEAPGRDAARARELHDRLVKTVAIARRVWIELARLLYEIDRTEAWRDLGFESWNKYLRSEQIGLDAGYASALKNVWRDLVAAGQLEPADLSEIPVANCLVLSSRREERGGELWNRMMADARSMTGAEFRRSYALKSRRGPRDRRCPHCGGEL